MKKYYLAYGSNLNKKMMKERCPDAKALGYTIIEDYRLNFRGKTNKSYLTIDKEKGSQVKLGVWSISDSCEKALDRYENYPDLYYKKYTDIICTDYKGKESNISALIYIMNEGQQISKPSPSYYESCLRGFEDFGFDASLLEEALERTKF